MENIHTEFGITEDESRILYYNDPMYRHLVDSLVHGASPYKLIMELFRLRMAMSLECQKLTEKLDLIGEHLNNSVEGSPFDNDEELFGSHEPFCDVCEHPNICMITGCSSLRNFIDPIPHHNHESYVEPGQTHDDEMP